MRIGDILVKLAKQQPLGGDEEAQLRLWGNQQESVNSFIYGLQNGSSDIFANSISSNDNPFFNIATVSPAQDSASESVSIPSVAKHLILLGSARTDRAAYNDVLAVNFNDDFGANYLEQFEGAQASTQVQGMNKTQTYATLSITTAASSLAQAVGPFWAVLPHIQSSKWKSIIYISGSTSYSSGGDMLSRTGSCYWSNTAPIKKITITSGNSANILAGSLISVLGFR